MEWLCCLPCTRVHHNNHSINIISNWENPLPDSDMQWPFNLWIMVVLCLFSREIRSEFSLVMVSTLIQILSRKITLCPADGSCTKAATSFLGRPTSRPIPRQRENGQFSHNTNNKLLAMLNEEKLWMKMRQVNEIHN